MTETNNTLVRSSAVEPTKPVLLPLKAERIQLILLALDLGNRPYDFANESAAERAARLDDGWRKRTSGPSGQSHQARDAA